jgi:hypothetical protein
MVGYELDGRISAGAGSFSYSPRPEQLGHNLTSHPMGKEGDFLDRKTVGAWN